MKEITENNFATDPFELADLPATDLAVPTGPHNDDGGTRSFLATLNHYNYFTEVEDEFVRRRGSHLLVSPMDWALIQTWKDAGVPLNIVLRGINQSFDGYDKRPLKTRKINSLLYCLQEVETCYAVFRESQVGAHTPAAETPKQGPAASGSKIDEMSKQTILEFLTSRFDSLKNSHEKAAVADNIILTETLDRSLMRLAEIIGEIKNANHIDSEGLERDLTSIEDLILEKLVESVHIVRQKTIEEDGKAQLKTYKRQMPKEIYEQTLANYISKRLRELYAIPRLSLFYMF